VHKLLTDMALTIGASKIFYFSLMQPDLKDSGKESLTPFNEKYKVLIK
jgi:hypothetical protein